jgi:TolB protein
LQGHLARLGFWYFQRRIFMQLSFNPSGVLRLSANKWALFAAALFNRVKRLFFTGTVAKHAIERLNSLARLSIVCLLGAALSPAWAQLSVEIGGNGVQQYPVAIHSFVGDAASDEFTAVLRSDLTKSGIFKLIDAGGKLADTQMPALANLRAAGADAVVWGGVTRNASGFEMRLRIHDTVRNTVIDNIALQLRSDARFSAHQVADRVYEKVTGYKGFFTSRLAYVTQLGRDSYELRVADWDGQYAQVALRSKEAIISPTFSPDGSRLAYVSFESRKASVYVHDLATGARRVVANYRGSNSAPAFSPAGNGLALVLSKDGLAQIYSMDQTGANLRRLTQSNGIDTEPAYSADGGQLFFVSDRGGQPQIYKMSAAGGNAQRVTFTGDYNISPALSPDGRLLSYITRRSGRFMAAVLDLNSQQETIVSDGSADESPSFAANSQFVLFASKQRGRGVLVLASVDGKVRTTLSMSTADIREPAFSAPLK